MGTQPKPNALVKRYLTRIASKDQADFPNWDIEKQLPKLPVPDLKLTISRYLKMIRAITTDDQYRQTEVIANEFSADMGIGSQLQEKLKEFAEKEENWAYVYWLNDMYMDIKLALPINSNPGMVLPCQQFTDNSQTKMLQFLSKVIAGILDYKVIIDRHELPIDRANTREPGQPLCMEQYYRLFRSYRRPGVERDQQVVRDHSDTGKSGVEHFIVMYDGQAFCLETSSDERQLSEENFLQQLERIVEMAAEARRSGQLQDDADQISLLTALPRDQWAKARERLMKNETNAENLEMIETSVCILCIDNCADPMKPASQRTCTDLFMQMLCGTSVEQNAANRWYDKTLQMICSRDGALGLNYEHSVAEGIAVIRLIEHLFSYVEEVDRMKLRRSVSLNRLPHPKQLQWALGKDNQEDIVQARRFVTRLDLKVGSAILVRSYVLINNTDIKINFFADYGRDFPKQNKISPDSFIQLALQLTYYRLHGRLVSTYESASTRRFQQGRVDNIRAASVEALEWCKAMLGEQPNTDSAEKRQLLDIALTSQTDYMVKTILGEGMDCHLVGLRETARDNGYAIPAFFNDDSFQLSNHFSLSTSQVPTSSDSFMGYGPVVPDGYGVSYNPQKNRIIFCITSFNDCTETSSERFSKALYTTLREMHTLVTGS